MNTALHNFKKLLLILVLLLEATVTAQTPMFYNMNTGTILNSYPFDYDSSGKKVQYLIRAHEFSQLYPSYSGYISKLYILMGTTNTKTFTNLLIKFGQTTSTDLPTGAIYNGQLDTVFFRASGTLSCVLGYWMPITLDRPYLYDTSKSLIIDISHCGTSYGGMVIKESNLTGNRKTICNNTSCIATFTGQWYDMPNLGIDIVPLGLPPMSYYFTQWCPAGRYPPIPTPSCYGAAAIIGDTLYMEIGSTNGQTSSPLFYKYSISGNTWTAGNSLPAPRAQGTLTACNGNLYYMGGALTLNTPLSDVFEYSPSTGQWVTKASMGFISLGQSALNWGDSVITIIGGLGNGYTSTIWYYRPASNTWNISSSQFYGFNLISTQAGGIIGNRMFLAGGYALSYTNQLALGTFGSNPDQIFWVSGSPIPSCGKRGIGGVGIRGRFYIVGGQNQVGPVASDSSFVYDITANQWQIVNSLKPHPVANVNASTVAWIHDDSVRIACLGGSDLSSNPTNYFDVIGCGPVEIGIQNISGSIPATFSLMQNYPNPFNPTTVIEYSVPKSGKVELNVYDVLGREIAILVNEFKSPGKYEIKFDGTNYASGLYFYKLTIGSFTETKKMVLIK